MKKYVIQLAMTACMLVILSAHLYAQNIHIVGTGTTETNYPPNTQVFEYGWSTMLYTSEEMGEAKAIAKIAFDQTVDFGGYWEYAVLDNQKIYIKQVDLTTFSSLAYEDPDNSANGYTQVFNGTIQFNLSWTQIELSDVFDYDGTSALIIHWENHRGTSAPIINVKFNASSVDENVFKALGGDGVFPTSFGTFIMDRPNLAVYYDGDGPATPANPTPANNSFKALTDTDLEFFIGDNTTTYDVYFGNTNPPTDLLLDDEPVSSSGSYICNPAAILGNLLDSYTNYYWQVVASDGSTTTTSEIWNFTTQGVIEDFPYFTSFEDMPIRTIVADTVDWSWPLESPSNWHMDSAYSHSGLVNVACNIWGQYSGYGASLISPRMYLPANQRVNFWWKIYGGDLSGIDVYFEITTDGGESWETLQQFEPEAPMANFEQVLINLAGYEGNNVYFRWRYESLANTVADYFFMDDLTIEAAPTGAFIQVDEPEVLFPPIAIGGLTYLPLEVANIGSEDLVITGSSMSAPFDMMAVDPIAPGQSETVYITMTATSQGDFNQNIEFTGDFEGTAVVELTASAYQITYNFFENADLSLELPENWSVIRTSDPYDPFTNVTVKETAYDAYSPPNAFKIMKMNDFISPLMLITEGVGAFGPNKLTFYAKKSYNDYDAELHIGLTTDPLHAEEFETVATFEMTTEYQQFEVEFPASTTKPYISFSFVDGSEWSAATIWLDDISWDEAGSYPPYCPNVIFPENEIEDIDVMMGLSLTWTSGGGNPTGYKLSLGTNPEANNILDGEDLGNVLSYEFPTIPPYNEQYFWKVVAYNNYGDSPGCSIQSFTTMENPVLSVPFAENFDGLDAMGEREYPLGWSVENANNDNFPWDLISNIATPGLAHSAPNAMHMLFSLNTMDDYLFTPPVQLEAGWVYELSFWNRTMGDSWVPNPVEKMKVLVGTNNNSTSMTNEIFDNQNLNYLSWTQENISFSVSESGEYYIGFYGYSTPNQGLLLVDDVQIDVITATNEVVEKTVSIFPNPATSKIQIQSDENIQQLSIYSMEGKLVYVNNYYDNRVSLDITKFKDGIYMVFVETDNGTIREKLIIH